MRSWDKKKVKYLQKFQTDSKKANTENDFLKLSERLFTETNLNHLQDVPLFIQTRLQVQNKSPR